MRNFSDRFAARADLPEDLIDGQSTACSKSGGVDGSLYAQTVPLASATMRSVNVPPTSAPIRNWRSLVIISSSCSPHKTYI